MSVTSQQTIPSPERREHIPPGQEICMPASPSSATSSFARSARHPGAPDPVRIVSLAGNAASLDFTLQAGMNLRDAISAPLAAAGIQGATVRFENLRVSPHHFLMPALSHDGKRQGGHLLTDQTIVAAPAVAQAWGLQHATMETRFDPETNYTLFHPAVVNVAQHAGDSTGGPRTVLARIRPDQDLNMAIEDICRAHGIRHARVRGSVGSIIGAEFEDGRVVEDLATEILVKQGHVQVGADGLCCHLEIVLIDPRGNVCEGVLARGRNPVLICFELVLEELAD